MALMIGYIFTFCLMIGIVVAFVILVKSMIKKEIVGAILGVFIALIVSFGLSLNILYKAEQAEIANIRKSKAQQCNESNI